MKLSRVVGSVSQKLSIYIQDATVSTGAGLANISAANVTFTIFRDDMTSTSTGTCSTSTGTLGTYNVSCLTQMSSTLALGWYQFDPPNYAFASGSSCLIHLYGAASMAPLPIEIELTKFDNQSYVSTVNVLGAVNPVSVSSINAKVGVSTLVGVSTVTIPVGVSSLTAGVHVSSIDTKVGVSTLVGVSTVTIPVGVSSISIPVGVSTVTDKAGYSVSSLSVSVNASTVSGLVGVSSVTTPVTASSVTDLVGVSTMTIPVGVSSLTLPVGVSSMSNAVRVSSASIPFGVSTVTDKIDYFLDATYGAAGALSTNIAFVKGVAVASGVGTSSNPWGP